MGKLLKKDRFVIREYSQLGCNLLLFPKAKSRRKKTDNLAEEIRHDYNVSYNIGGVNYHVSEAVGFIVHVNKIDIYDTRTKKVVATAKAPMFEVI
ncbi:hypothetical protein phiOC_p215 [Ochrobactrum phage vB_OspM_OC]|nr:hypothetical protein phiOC_p215 [Ochrobactrum phage vB_OspM_OC]